MTTWIALAIAQRWDLLKRLNRPKITARQPYGYRLFVNHQRYDFYRARKMLTAWAYKFAVWAYIQRSAASVSAAEKALELQYFVRQDYAAEALSRELLSGLSATFPALTLNLSPPAARS